MNLKSLEYFVEIAKDLNMTSAAQRLYISQQALSLQVQKLENYYGVALFERQPKLQLTYAGMQLLESATRILKENTDIRNELSEISKNHFGVLRVGMPVSRAAASLPMVLPEFSKKWPNVSLQLEEKPSSAMLQMVCDGTLDIAIGTPGRAEIQGYSDKLEFVFLLDDPTYLICSDELLEQYFGERAEEIKRNAAGGTELKEFSDLPYILHRPPMMLRKVADDCFHRAGFKPKIYIEASNTDLIVSLYPCHQGAFFCRKAKLPALLHSFPNCNVFPVQSNGEQYQVPVYLMRRKSNRTPAHLLDFEYLMCRAWAEIAEF